MASILFLSLIKSNGMDNRLYKGYLLKELSLKPHDSAFKDVNNDNKRMHLMNIGSHFDLSERVNLIMDFDYKTSLVNYFSLHGNFYERDEDSSRVIYYPKNCHLICLRLEKGHNYEYSIETSQHKNAAEYYLDNYGEIIRYKDINGNEWTNDWGIPFPFISIEQFIMRTIHDRANQF